MANHGGETASMKEVIRFFARLGCVSFGGPAGQIAMLREELVEKRRWLGADEFVRGLNFCLLLPGPEAHQLAIYSGWKMQGVRGAVAAAVLFVLPAALLLWSLSVLYAFYGQIASVQSVFAMVRPAVLVIIIAALVRMARHHLGDGRAWSVAGSAFVAMFFFVVPFPWVVVFAIGLGLLAHIRSAESPVRAEVPAARTSWAAVVLIALLWSAPLALTVMFLGAESVLASLGLFFSKAALITFGGAYAILPYAAEHAVNAGWLTPAAMRDGLALAETTPGPLVIVLQFVGFFAGWNNPAPMPPLVMATMGAAITTWVTFLPSLLFILLGAPHVDRLTQSPRAATVMATLGAAVVGVIANLTAWYATGVFFGGQDRILSACAAGMALWLLVGRGWSIPSVVGIAVGAGLLRALLG